MNDTRANTVSSAESRQTESTISDAGYALA
jgi:hypothetical protein